METIRRYIIRKSNPKMRRIIDLYEEIQLFLFYVKYWILKDFWNEMKRIVGNGK